MWYSINSDKTTVGVALKSIYGPYNNNKNFGITGKVCIPDKIVINDVTYPITSILGSAVITELDGSQKSGFRDNEGITHIFI